MEWFNSDGNRAMVVKIGLTSLALIALVMVLASLARADGPTKRSQIAAPAATAPARTWTGIYGGVFGGYGLGEISPSGSPVGLSSSGSLAGVNAGLTLQTGQVVFGAEIAHAWTFGDLKDLGIKTEIEYTGRLGIVFGNALLYGHGSFVQLSVDGLGTIEGWKFGPGVEVKLTDAGWSVDLRGGYAVYDIESMAPGLDANMLWGRVGLVKRFDMPAGWFGQ